MNISIILRSSQLQPHMGVEAIKDELAHKFRVHVQKKKLYKVKKKALFRTSGDFTLSYTKLSSYAKIIMHRKLDAIAKVGRHCKVIIALDTKF